MNNDVKRDKLTIDSELCAFVENELVPGTDIDLKLFWAEFSTLVEEMAPRNQLLLEKREQLQSQIDQWHLDNSGQSIDAKAYESFLLEIGYLVKTGEDFSITTANVDKEIAELAGPQLVVPLKNARFALNAANARWASLYDALYGTNAISDEDGAAAGSGYNPIRGKKVIEFGRKHIDQVAALSKGSHLQSRYYKIQNGQLLVGLSDGSETGLAEPEKFVGYLEANQQLNAILLCNNGIHIEIQIDPQGNIGREDPAGIQDILVESALTTIMDCEDSIAAVDAEDKTETYRNWLGLMKGNLSFSFQKGGSQVNRTMNPDREYQTPLGNTLTLPGRSILFVRNVGHLMTNSAITYAGGKEIPEGIMDGVFTTMAAIHDLKGNTTRNNTRTGSVYIVKPKMHGPEEVAFSVELFDRIEKLLNLKPNTIKIGIMDEERRTTINLKECIRAASERVAFINTGFLDRTGDEIHTSMKAGAFVPKSEMKQQAWINAYEDWNVDVGLTCGLKGKAQIGKGMWAMPDEMAAMIEQKIAHPKAGANTAWVPSPTGAALHSVHYHQVNVAARQEELMSREPAKLSDILHIPLLSETAKASLTKTQIQAEIDNNAQGILGYVVRWIDQGVGCSKVPDINDIGLMEDRATLRISSQYLANWLRHHICTQDQVIDSLKRMAKVVDQQNASDSLYEAMAPNYDGIAFQAACSLIFEGETQPSGYTEPLLHSYRIKKKASINHLEKMIS